LGEEWTLFESVCKVSKDQDDRQDAEDQQVNQDMQDESNRMDVQTVEDDNAGESRNMPAPPPSSSADSKKPKKKQLEQEVNPTRSLGDALKHWKKKLNVVDDQKEEEEKAAAEENQNEGPQPPEDNENANYEYVRDETMAENQTLGAATEEQAAEFDMKDGMFDEEEKKDKGEEEGAVEDEMQIDQAPVPDEKKEIKLNPSTKFAAADKSKQNKDLAKEMEGDEKEGEEGEKKNIKDGEEHEDEDDKMREDDELKLVSKGTRAKLKDEEENPLNDAASAAAVPPPPPPALTHEQVIDMRQELDLFLARWREDPNNMAFVRFIGFKLSLLCFCLQLIRERKFGDDFRLLLEPAPSSYVNS